jgi:hypothetical protein
MKSKSPTLALRRCALKWHAFSQKNLTLAWFPAGAKAQRLMLNRSCDFAAIRFTQGPSASIWPYLMLFLRRPLQTSFLFRLKKLTSEWRIIIHARSSIPEASGTPSLMSQRLQIQTTKHCLFEACIVRLSRMVPSALSWHPNGGCGRILGIDRWRG